MTIEQSVDIQRELVSTSLAASAPVLITAVVIGVVIFYPHLKAAF